MAGLDELLNEISRVTTPARSAAFAEWVRASRRFEAFAAGYHRKIRARLSAARSEDALHAVWAELETAAALLSEKQFTLEYEKYAPTRQRGPDFTVTFRTHTPFNVEVRRMRSEPSAEARASKLVAVICDKTGQMPPGMVNVLWLVCDDQVTEADLISATLTLRQLADRKTEDFFKRYGFRDAAEFLRHYRYLSAIMLWQAAEPALWLNPLARHAVPVDIQKALRRLVQR